jgi:hypothetical protein
MGRSKASFHNLIPLHDLTQGFPEGVYDNLHQYTRSPMVIGLLSATRGNPRKMTRIHILGKPGSRGVNPGDEGSLDRDYLVQKGRETMPEGFKVLSKSVSAKELFTSGDVNKWVWNPGKTEQ